MKRLNPGVGFALPFEEGVLQRRADLRQINALGRLTPAKQACSALIDQSDLPFRVDHDQTGVHIFDNALVQFFRAKGILQQLFFGAAGREELSHHDRGDIGDRKQGHTEDAGLDKAGAVSMRGQTGVGFLCQHGCCCDSRKQKGVTRLSEDADDGDVGDHQHAQSALYAATGVHQHRKTDDVDIGLQIELRVVRGLAHAHQMVEHYAGGEVGHQCFVEQRMIGLTEHARIRIEIEQRCHANEQQQTVVAEQTQGIPVRRRGDRRGIRECAVRSAVYAGHASACRKQRAG